MKKENEICSIKNEFKEKHLSDMQARQIINARLTPLNKRNFTDSCAVRGIVGSSPKEQCDSAKRFAKKRGWL